MDWCESPIRIYQFPTLSNLSLFLQSKQELLATLPELAKSTNGISWVLSKMPSLLIDEETLGVVVSVSDSSVEMELKM